MAKIRLPNNWQPRPYQLPLWRYLENGGRRAVAVWHRRAGKDDVCLHWAATAAMQRVGNYWHMLPEASQARKAIWEAINPHTGKRRIDEAFPAELRDVTRENEMFLRFKNGSTWQVVGSDNYDSLVGAPPIGVVFSEWALADPNSWAYLRPILLENGGWAFFIYTPRGRNHGATFFENASNTDGWFAQKLSAEQTGVFTPEQLRGELSEYIADYGEDDGETRYRQEYLCDFDVAIIGSYYGRLMSRADDEGRVCNVPYDPRFPVHTAWDLGIGDSTAIWFAQMVGKEVRIIDYLQNNGVALEWYAREVLNRPYSYGDHYLPHDAEASELISGTTRVMTLKGLGIKGSVLPRETVEDGINAARLLLPRCWFDKTKCARGVDALRNYRREFDEKHKVFKNKPLHDWSSDAADAFRYLAMGLPKTERRGDRPAQMPQKANNAYRPHFWR